jgi:hypothetical protein
MAKAENSGRLTPSINAGVGRIIVAIIYEQLLNLCKSVDKYLTILFVFQPITKFKQAIISRFFITWHIRKVIFHCFF